MHWFFLSRSDYRAKFKQIKVTHQPNSYVIGYVLISIITLLAMPSLQASEVPASYEQCIVCHGSQAQGNSDLKAPVLAGLSAEYLTRQLMNFRTGVRGSNEQDVLGAQMITISQQLDPETDIPALTAYLSALSTQPTEKTEQNTENNQSKTTGDLKNGSRYYQAKCGACHSGNGEGNPSFKAPKLAGQDIAYLKRQLLNFQTGVRGSHPDDKLGRQMAMMAKMTQDKELDDILHYIAQQE